MYGAVPRIKEIHDALAKLIECEYQFFISVLVVHVAVAENVRTNRCPISATEEQQQFCP